MPRAFACALWRASMKEKPMIKYTYRTEFPALLAEGAPRREVIQDQYDFLCDLWHNSGNARSTVFGNLCFRRKGSTKMIDKFFPLRGVADFDRILLRFDRHRFDQYFSPNVYSRRRRLVDCVVTTRLGWCDVDEANPFDFDPKPSLIWQTSPGRTQALWRWDRPHSAAQASAISKALAYRHGGDKGGSAANKLLRLPGSFTHKPGYDKPFIPLLHFDPQLITKRPKLLTKGNETHVAEPKALEMNPHGHDRISVWKKYRPKLKVTTGHLLRHNTAQAQDRSRRIFSIIAGLHEVGASIDEIAGAVWTSPYFRDKYGDDLDALETEVSRILARAEAAQ